MVRLNSVSGIFFRFFAGIWLTLLLVGALVWGASSFFTEAPSNYGSFERSPAAERAIGTALGIARWGGEDALITWLKDPEVNTRPEVFVLDPFGHEISGRSIPQKAAESLKFRSPGRRLYDAGTRPTHATVPRLPILCRTHRHSAEPHSTHHVENALVGLGSDSGFDFRVCGRQRGVDIHASDQKTAMGHAKGFSRCL